MFCVSVKVWRQSEILTWTSFLDFEDVRSLSLKAVWNY